MEGKVTVFYDGLCHLCSREINHYRSKPGADAIRFVDITGPEFDAAKEGVDPVQVHKVMHVRRADGRLATRVEAFMTIWDALPGYRWLARVFRNPVVRAGAEVGYSVFATARPYLPRKKADCSDSPYCEVRPS